jgi:hypothetical protein
MSKQLDAKKPVVQRIVHSLSHARISFVGLGVNLRMDLALGDRHGVVLAGDLNRFLEIIER